MRIETNRLLLRPLEPKDAEAYFKLSQNTGFLKFQISNYRRDSLSDARQWIEGQKAYFDRNRCGILGAFEKANGELIGLGALKYLDEEGASPIELMYRLHQEHWGKGYGTEISLGLVRHAFKGLKLSKLVAVVDPKNSQSKKILLALGFELKQVISIQSRFEELYELTREKVKVLGVA